MNGNQVDTSGDLKRFRGRQTCIPKMVALDNHLRTHSRNCLRFFSEASQEDADSAPMDALATTTEMDDDALPEEAGAGDNAAGQQAQVLPDTVQKYETAGTLEATGLWEDLPKAQEMYLDPDLALQALADSVVVRRQRKHVARAGQSREKSDEGEMSLSEDSDTRPRRRKRVARAGQSREKSDEGKMSLSEDSDTTQARNASRRSDAA